MIDQFCSNPKCNQEATHTFALAPLCEPCRNDVMKETKIHYDRKSRQYTNRDLYYAIYPFTIWGDGG